MDVLDAQPDSEYIFVQSRKPLPLHPSNGLAHRFRDFCWDRFGYARNKFDANDWYWIWKRPGEQPVRLEEPDSTWTHSCVAFKGNLPFNPDLVLGTTPHEGHMRYQAIPWANKAEIPVVSIDHGAPMVPYDFGVYRGSMMGCVANTCWGEVAADINAGYGAPPEGQVVTGSPTLDEIAILDDGADYRSEFGIDSKKRVILLMTTHRDPLKSLMDQTMQRVIERWGNSPDHQIVVKPHPVELLDGTLMELNEEIIVIRDQTRLHRVMRAANCIVSPASSIIIPAFAMEIPFVNIHQPGCGLADEAGIQILSDRLGGADIHPDEMDAVISGELQLDSQIISAAFEKFGYRADGNNSARILNLCQHIHNGGVPNDWTDPFN